MKGAFCEVSKMSERIINTWRDPYDEGFSTCRLKQITIKSGLTVLVGCNGAGKLRSFIIFRVN